MNQSASVNDSNPPVTANISAAPSTVNVSSSNPTGYTSLATQAKTMDATPETTSPNEQPAVKKPRQQKQTRKEIEIGYITDNDDAGFCLVSSVLPSKSTDRLQDLCAEISLPIIGWYQSFICRGVTQVQWCRYKVCVCMCNVSCSWCLSSGAGLIRLSVCNASKQFAGLSNYTDPFPLLSLLCWAAEVKDLL